MKEDNLNTTNGMNLATKDECRYVNPYTDFGFKLLFGTVANKELLIGFLNALLKLDSPIKDITYDNVEQQGDTAVARKAVFDVFCESESGDKFIVEMQKAEQDYFIDRSIYYASFPIRDQAKRGGWNFQLTKVYTIGILNFSFQDTGDNYYHHEVMLMDTRTKEVFFNKLTFVYLEMPKFHKTINECETFLDKWMFVLKNLTSLLDRPVELQQRVFKRLFEVAEIGKFTPSQMRAYEKSQIEYWDLVNVVNTAERKGKEEGRAEGIRDTRLDIAKQMKAAGMDTESIAAMTKIPISEIENL